MSIADQIYNSESADVRITLDADVVENIVIPNGKSVTINFNGHTISNLSETDAYTIANYGKLILNGDGTIYNDNDRKGCLCNYEEGVVIINGIDFRLSERTKTTAWYYIVNMGASMTIHNANVQGMSPNASTIRNGYYTEENTTNNKPVLVINDGLYHGALIPVKNDSYGVLHINGGYFDSPNECVLNWNQAEINGGTFITTDNYTVFSGAYTDPGCDGQIIINGGNFSGTKGIIKDLTPEYDPESTTASIGVAGGTFNMNVPSEYWKPGFEIVQDENGNFIARKTPEWTFPEGGAQGAVRGFMRLIIHNDTVEYEAGGFLPPRGFKVKCIFGAMAKGGIDAYFNRETGKIQLFRSGTEVTGVIEDCTIVLIGNQE